MYYLVGQGRAQKGGNVCRCLSFTLQEPPRTSCGAYCITITVFPDIYTGEVSYISWHIRRSATPGSRKSLSFSSTYIGFFRCRTPISRYVISHLRGKMMPRHKLQWSMIQRTLEGQSGQKKTKPVCRWNRPCDAFGISSANRSFRNAGNYFPYVNLVWYGFKLQISFCTYELRLVLNISQKVCCIWVFLFFSIIIILSSAVNTLITCERI